MHAAVGIKAVQRAGALSLVERHRTGPEPAGRIAFAVVHALIGTVGLDVGNHRDPPRCEVEPAEAVVHGEDEIAAFGWRDRTDHAADLERVENRGARVEPVDPAAQDVDEPQASRRGIPDRALAELGLGVDDELGVADGDHQTRIATGDATASGL